MKGLRRRGKRGLFSAYWYDKKTGRVIERSLGTTDEVLAERAFGRLQAQLDGQGGDAGLASQEFGALAEKYIRDIVPLKAEATKNPTISRIRKNLIPFFDKRRVCDIGVEQVVQYKFMREGQGAKGKSVQVELSNLKCVMNLALPEWTLPKGDQRMVYANKSKEIVRYFRDEDEFLALLAECPEWLRPMIVIARYTGLRQLNVMRMKWSEVNLFRRRIILEHTKNGKRHSVPMCDTVYDVFRSMRVEGEFLFPVPSGIGFGGYRQRCIKHFKAACARIGRPEFRWHDLRHDFCSQLVQRGLTLYQVSKLAGHSSTRMTERYAHLAPEDLGDNIKVLDFGNPLARNRKALNAKG